MGAWVSSLLGVASVVGCVGDSDFSVDFSVDCSEDQEDESPVNSGHFRLSSSSSIQQFRSIFSHRLMGFFREFMFKLVVSTGFSMPMLISCTLLEYAWRNFPRFSVLPLTSKVDDFPVNATRMFMFFVGE